MCPKDKLSGVKTVPQSDLRVGTSLGKPHDNNSNTLRILQWNAGGMSQYSSKVLESTNANGFIAKCKALKTTATTLLKP